MHLSSYVPLWCKSNFSFLEGASHPDELIEQAYALGIRSLALTDRDGLYGIVRAHRRAQEVGLKLLCGAQIHIADLPPMLAIAHHHQGYRNLCRLLTKGRRRSLKGESVVSLQEACEHAQGLTWIYTTRHYRARIPSNPTPQEVLDARQLQEASSNRFYLSISRQHLASDKRSEAFAIAMQKNLHCQIVAANEVLYHHRDRQLLHDAMSCIRNHVILDHAGRHVQENDESALQDPLFFCRRFHDMSAAVELTQEIANSCHFSLHEIRYRYPAEQLPNGYTTDTWLIELCHRGIAKRYRGTAPKGSYEQLAREMAIIQELDYSGYFLTMYEIVEYCNHRQILCQGRGSAANSLVCYLLGITSVDPVLMGFLFERFLSKERAEPPDIDLDIEHERREEVIAHMYEKYGRDKAAMVANVIRYRPKSALREIGKVLDIPENAIDRLSKQIDSHREIAPEHLENCGLSLEIPRHRYLWQLSNEILDFPRHLSIHPGGFLLGHEPVCDLVPIENASMPGRTVIQWDKDDIETLGLFKVDLLALGCLSHIHRCFDLIYQEHKLALELYQLPVADKATFDLICRAETIGVFQIESRAQMSMLPRLRPNCFYDLVIEISIVRPGPISGGMVHPYLRRRRGEEPVEYPHESLKPVLAKTLGVPLFQEQVMRLAMVAADYSPGEADQLRRDMAAWRKSGKLEQHHRRLVDRMVAKGIAEEFAERVFSQIRGFGEYGFPESHAASFAILAYATAWLRTHYFTEFICSLLNAQPLGFYTPATIIHDAKRNQQAFLPIDVNASQWDCSIEAAPNQPRAIRLGLRYLKGIRYDQAQAIFEQREQGDFSSVDDLIRRTKLDRRTIGNLAKSGAFASLQPDRRQALWQMHESLQTRQDILPLARPDVPIAALPELSFSGQILWDYATTQCSTHAHPLAAIRPTLRQQKFICAADLPHLSHGMRADLAALVICRQRPPTAAGVLFMTLEDETGLINAVFWPQVYELHAPLLRCATFLGLRGRIQRQEGVLHLIVEHAWAPELPATIHQPASRDFH